VDLAGFLPERAIRARAHADDWRAAIRLAGDGLIASGATTAAYSDEMIAAIDAHGPYVVIAPRIALAHSRPSPAVHRAGLSWVGLDEPVAFGHAVNDPVSLVIGLAAVDHDGHLEMMSALAGVLSDDDLVTRLLTAASAAEVRDLLTAAANDDGASTAPRQGDTP
jgi:PTS system ascorbate-specific IIA component